jgi:hypothetical protein
MSMSAVLSSIDEKGEEHGIIGTKKDDRAKRKRSSPHENNRAKREEPAA